MSIPDVMATAPSCGFIADIPTCEKGDNLVSYTLRILMHTSNEHMTILQLGQIMVPEGPPFRYVARLNLSLCVALPT